MLLLFYLFIITCYYFDDIMRDIDICFNIIDNISLDKKIIIY